MFALLAITAKGKYEEGKLGESTALYFSPSLPSERGRKIGMEIEKGGREWKR